MALLVPGLLLTAASWFVAWSRIPILTDYSFFPLWLGYILTVNGICEVVLRDSLMRRMGLSFVWLFLLSIPLWWFFEYMNSIVQNWHYRFAYPISDLHYTIQASIDFATVIPAVLSTSFLFYRWLRERDSRRFRPSRPTTRSLAVGVLLGVAGLLLIDAFPREAFPLVWIAPLLILEPIADWLGVPSLLFEIRNRNWTLPLSVMLATLFTGFFWEMWNFYSLPKWIYTIPYVGFWKVFEMPIIGYLGYLPFGLVIYSYTALVFSVLAKARLPFSATIHISDTPPASRAIRSSA
jgi:hypothetical protein